MKAGSAAWTGLSHRQTQYTPPLGLLAMREFFFLSLSFLCALPVSGPQTLCLPYLSPLRQTFRASRFQEKFNVSLTCRLLSTLAFLSPSLFPFSPPEHLMQKLVYERHLRWYEVLLVSTPPFP